MRILPAFIKTPEPLRDPKSLITWIQDSLLIFINRVYRVLSDRSEEMIQEGTLAQIPSATGKRRFYYATDTDDLYYDVGSWKKVGHGV